MPISQANDVMTVSSHLIEVIELILLQYIMVTLLAST